MNEHFLPLPSREALWNDPERRHQKVAVWLDSSEGVKVVNHMDVHDACVVDGAYLHIEFSNFRTAGHPLSAVLRWEVSA